MNDTQDPTDGKQPASDQQLHARFRAALQLLQQCPEFARLIPEVRTNLVYARLDATTPDDVLAVDGRITVIGGYPCATGSPVFGASDHMARLIIELNRIDSSIRAGINFANNPTLAEWLRDYANRHGWVFSVIDRSREPEDLQREERPSIPWKVVEAVRAAEGRAPKLCYETASIGKEPLTFLVGADPVEVTEQACVIAREWARNVSPEFCTRWAQPGSQHSTKGR
jgi:hydroxymethylpyrimidine/phosphomethylpyrimidine kinase